MPTGPFEDKIAGVFRDGDAIEKPLARIACPDQIGIFPGFPNYVQEALANRGCKVRWLIPDHTIASMYGRITLATRQTLA